MDKQSKITVFFEKTKKSNIKSYFIYDAENTNAFFSDNLDPNDIFINYIKKCCIIVGSAHQRFVVSWSIFFIFSNFLFVKVREQWSLNFSVIHKIQKKVFYSIGPGRRKLVRVGWQSKWPQLLIAQAWPQSRFPWGKNDTNTGRKQKDKERETWKRRAVQTDR